jgi:hypothetical protein
MTDPEVRIPAGIVDADAKDIATPVSDLLTRLELLPEEGDAGDNKVGVVGGTPYSLQVITSGALSLNKWAATAIAALGGSGAITAGLTGFWSGEATPVRVALVGGLALVLSALAVSVAMIVRGDTLARGDATSMEYQARAIVTQAFLELAGATKEQPSDSTTTLGTAEAADPLLPSLAAHSVLLVSGEGMASTRVTGVRKLTDGTFELHAADDWVPVSRVESYSLEQIPPVDPEVIDIVIAQLGG